MLNYVLYVNCNCVVGWTLRFLMGGLCKSPKKYRACASGFKKISYRIVKKEKNSEQPYSEGGKGFLLLPCLRLEVPIS